MSVIDCSNFSSSSVSASGRAAVELPRDMMRYWYPVSKTTIREVVVPDLSLAYLTLWWGRSTRESHITCPRAPDYKADVEERYSGGRESYDIAT